MAENETEEVPYNEAWDTMREATALICGAFSDCDMNEDEASEQAYLVAKVMAGMAAMIRNPDSNKLNFLASKAKEWAKSSKTLHLLTDPELAVVRGMRDGTTYVPKGSQPDLDPSELVTKADLDNAIEALADIVERRVARMSEPVPTVDADTFEYMKGHPKTTVEIDGLDELVTWEGENGLEKLIERGEVVVQDADDSAATTTEAATADASGNRPRTDTTALIPENVHPSNGGQGNLEEAIREVDGDNKPKIDMKAFREWKDKVEDKGDAAPPFVVDEKKYLAGQLPDLIDMITQDKFEKVNELDESSSSEGESPKKQKKDRKPLKGIAQVLKS